LKEINSSSIKQVRMRNLNMDVITSQMADKIVNDTSLISGFVSKMTEINERLNKEKIEAGL